MVFSKKVFDDLKDLTFNVATYMTEDLRKKDVSNDLGWLREFMVEEMLRVCLFPLSFVLSF